MPASRAKWKTVMPAWRGTLRAAFTRWDNGFAVRNVAVARQTCVNEGGRMFQFMKKLKTLLPAEATLPGRKMEMDVPDEHFVNGHPIKAPFPAGLELAQFGMGCFWGAER